MHQVLSRLSLSLALALGSMNLAAAPQLPMIVSTNTNGRPSCTPPIEGSVAPPLLSAVTRSGTACASAPSRQSIMRNPLIPRAPQAAGLAMKLYPSLSVNDRKVVLDGISGTKAGAKAIAAPMAGGPFVASPGEMNMTEAEPRAKDESWNERREKPAG